MADERAELLELNKDELLKLAREEGIQDPSGTKEQLADAILGQRRAEGGDVPDAGEAGISDDDGGEDPGRSAEHFANDSYQRESLIQQSEDLLGVSDYVARAALSHIDTGDDVLTPIPLKDAKKAVDAFVHSTNEG